MIEPSITTALMRQTCALMRIAGLIASAHRARLPRTILRCLNVRFRTICVKGPEGQADTRRSRSAVYLRVVMTTFADLGLDPDILAGRPRCRLRVAQPDPGAGDPAAAPGPRRDRSGADRLGQDGGVRAADAPVRRPGRARRPGAGAHADPRAVHPGDPGAARVRPAQGGRRGGRVRRRADPLPAGAAARRRPRRRGDGRPGQGPDLAPLADAPRRAASSCSTRPTRCSTSASSRTSSGSSR